MSTSYKLICPNEGAPLFPVVLGPESAPWVCVVCRQGWYASELTKESRAAWRVDHQDFGYGVARDAVKAAREAEVASALERGTSAREDQLDLLPLHALNSIRATGAFADKVKAEAVRKTP